MCQETLLAFFALVRFRISFWVGLLLGAILGCDSGWVS